MTLPEPCELPPPAACFQYAGAVFVYRRGADGSWARDAYLKALDPDEDALFGSSLALDGDTLAVGASNGGPDNHGRVYVFTRDPTTRVWSPQVAELSSTSTVYGNFGYALALEGDTLAIGAPADASSGVHMFTRSAGTWTEQVTLSEPGDFGAALGLSKGTLAVSADTDASGATGVGGDASDTTAPSSGAVHVYVGSGATWTKQAYLKASNTRMGAQFGNTLAIFGDTLAVGAYAETSDARGIGGDQANASMAFAGAAYFFVRSGAAWSQRAYVKASNTQPNAWFGGSSLALSADTLIAGAQQESSRASGVNGKPQDDTSTLTAGAVYAF
jgi:hypothetical protein